MPGRQTGDACMEAASISSLEPVNLPPFKPPRPTPPYFFLPFSHHFNSHPSSSTPSLHPKVVLKKTFDQFSRAFISSNGPACVQTFDLLIGPRASVIEEKKKSLFLSNPLPTFNLHFSVSDLTSVWEGQHQTALVVSGYRRGRAPCRASPLPSWPAVLPATAQSHPPPPGISLTPHTSLLPSPQAPSCDTFTIAYCPRCFVPSELDWRSKCHCRMESSLCF